MQAVLASLKNAQTFFPRGKACCLLSSFKELRAPLGYTCALRGRDMCSCLVAAVLRAPPTRQVQGPWALRTHSRLVIGAVYECAPTPACMQRPITKRAVPQNDTRWDAHACTHARTHTRTRIHARLRTQTNTCALARAHTHTHTHTHMLCCACSAPSLSSRAPPTSRTTLKPTRPAQLRNKATAVTPGRPAARLTGTPQPCRP